MRNEVCLTIRSFNNNLITIVVLVGGLYESMINAIGFAIGIPGLEMTSISCMCDDPTSRCICRVLPSIQPAGFHQNYRRRYGKSAFNDQPGGDIPKHQGTIISRPKAILDVPDAISDYGFKLNIHTTERELDEAYANPRPSYSAAINRRRGLFKTKSIKANDDANNLMDVNDDKEEQPLYLMQTLKDGSRIHIGW
jgi:hypothetical protein